MIAGLVFFFSFFFGTISCIRLGSRDFCIFRSRLDMMIASFLILSSGGTQ